MNPVDDIGRMRRQVEERPEPADWADGLLGLVEDLADDLIHERQQAA